MEDRVIKLSRLRSIMLTSTEIVTIIAVIIFFYAFTNARNKIINEKLRNLNEETIELTINLNIFLEKISKTIDTIAIDTSKEINSIIERSITDKNIKAFIIDSFGNDISDKDQKLNNIQSILTNDNSIEKGFEYNGTKHLLSYRKLKSYENNKWTVVLLKNQESILSGYSYKTMGILIAAIILFLFAEHIISYVIILKNSHKHID